MGTANLDISKIVYESGDQVDSPSLIPTYNGMSAIPSYTETEEGPVLNGYSIITGEKDQSGKKTITHVYAADGTYLKSKAEDNSFLAGLKEIASFVALSAAGYFGVSALGAAGNIGTGAGGVLEGMTTGAGAGAGLSTAAAAELAAITGNFAGAGTMLTAGELAAATAGTLGSATTGLEALGTGLGTSSGGITAAQLAAGTAEGLIPEGAAGTFSGGAGYIAPGVTGAGAAGAGTAMSRILAGTATGADWLSALGTAAPGLIGAYGATQQGESLERIAEQARADRAPFLAKSQEWLAGGPEAYGAGPGAGALRGVLANLSAQGGNPIGSGSALSIASQAGLADWRNAYTGAASIGLGGNQAQLDTNAAIAGSPWAGLGKAASDVFAPAKDTSFEDWMRRQTRPADIFNPVTGVRN